MFHIIAISIFKDRNNQLTWTYDLTHDVTSDHVTIYQLFYGCTLISTERRLYIVKCSLKRHNLRHLEWECQQLWGKQAKKQHQIITKNSIIY